LAWLRPQLTPDVGARTMATDQYLQKARADRLTEMLASTKSIREVERILDQESLISGGGDTPANKPSVEDCMKAKPPSSLPKKIGIWEPVLENGEVAYVRSQNGDPRKLWANVKRINPKRNKFRIVLLGESVARGWCLDPGFNCATALQTILESATSRQDIEVIDLARNSLNIAQLKELVDSAAAIEPDMFVIFAGNNWRLSDFHDAIDYEKAGEILRQERNWMAVRDYAESVLRHQVSLLVEYLVKRSKEWSIPILFIIPEFNLLDWETNHTWQSPLVSNELIKLRSSIKADAENAITMGDINLATELGERLVTLDEGANPIGFEILAKCKMIRGMYSEARQYKEKAIDSCFTMPFMISRCFFAVQETLRKVGSSEGLLIVDMPRIFQEYLPAELPGRKHFFDFCHMTVDGIWVSMASAAEKILPFLGASSYSWPNLKRYEYPVDCKVIAKAHFTAAIVNAYSGQGHEIINYHCFEALKQYPEIHKLMRLVMECHLRKTHSMKHINGYNEYSIEPFMTLSIMNPSNAYYGSNDLSPQLTQAVTSAISETDTAIASEIGELLVQEHCVTDHGVDLLSRSYVDVAVTNLEYFWETRNAFFKSYQAETRFRLICEKPEGIYVRFIYRVPSTDALGREVKLLVNGKFIQSFNIDTKWQTSKFTIPCELLQRGINSLAIRWPEPIMERERRVDEAANALESIAMGGRINNMYKVYGEIYEFKAFSQRNHSAGGSVPEF
jgi:hypothetical protein